MISGTVDKVNRRGENNVKNKNINGLHRRYSKVIAIVYGNNTEALNALREACAQGMDRPPLAEYPVGCVISINTGPNMVGILYRT